jgi:hypothetical protein
VAKEILSHDESSILAPQAIKKLLVEALTTEVNIRELFTKESIILIIVKNYGPSLRY